MNLPPLFCSNCGKQIAEGARFCKYCGAAQEAVETTVRGQVPADPLGTPPVGVPPVDPRQQRVSADVSPLQARAAYGSRVSSRASIADTLTSPEALLRLLRAPFLGGLAATGLSLVIGLVFAGILYALIAPDDRQEFTIGTVLHVASSLPYLFLKVALVFSGRASEFDVFESGRFSVAPLGGFALMAVAFVAAGAIAARIQRGGLAENVRAGALMGVPLGIIFLILSFLVTVHLPDTESIKMEPSHTSAFFLPLIWGSLFGAIGALRHSMGGESLRSRLLSTRGRLRPLAAATRAALSGIGLGLLLTLVTLIVIVAVLWIKEPDDFESVVSSGRSVASAILALLLFLPNYVGAAFLASMGAALTATGFASGNETVSISIFGATTAEFGDQFDVPGYYVLALLVPLLATLRMGYVAARESHGGPRDAVITALISALPFTLMCWSIAWLCGVHYDLADEEMSLAPSSVGSFFLPILWGSVGAWVGSLIWIQRNPSATGSAAPPRTSGPVGHSGSAPPAATPAYTGSQTGAIPQEGAASPASATCPHCGRANPPTNRFCEGCGRALAQPDS